VPAKKYLVNVSIENKKGTRDPEGETIYNDLIMKSGLGSIHSVNVAKLLKISIQANNPEQAINSVQNMCDKLRIYNPLAHSCSISIADDES
jgi:phosphoribosylformylglycinamidine synthase